MGRGMQACREVGFSELAMKSFLLFPQIRKVLKAVAVQSSELIVHRGLLSCCAVLENTCQEWVVHTTIFYKNAGMCAYSETSSVDYFVYFPSVGFGVISMI